MLSAWSRPIPTQLKPPAGTLPLAAFVLLLVLCLGNSTVAAQWVPASGGLTSLALVAAFVMGIVALVRRVPWTLALIVGLLLTPIAAYVSVHGALVHAHPDDPADPF